MAALISVYLVSVQTPNRRDKKAVIAATSSILRLSSRYVTLVDLGQVWCHPVERDVQQWRGIAMKRGMLGAAVMLELLGCCEGIRNKETFFFAIDPNWDDLFRSPLQQPT